MPRFAKVLIGIALVPVVLVLLIGLYLALFTTPISLNIVKGPLQKAVSKQIGWHFEIRGDIFLVPGLKPSLEVNEVALNELPGQPDELFFARRMYLELDLLALLDSNFEIGEISFSDLQLALRIDQQGRPNWKMPDGAVLSKQQEASSERETDSGESWYDLLDINKVNLNLTRAHFENISFSYEDRLRNTKLTAAIDQGQASIRWNDPMTLSLRGHSNDIPVALELEATAFSSLLNPQSNWESKSKLTVDKLEMLINIALIASPGSNQREPTLGVDIRGDSLEELVALLEVPLPPWGPYHLGGKFGFTDAGYYLEDVALGIGQSNLSGKITLEVNDDHPSITAKFHSPLIDTRDFELGDWEGFEFDTATTTDQQQENESLLNPELLKNFDVDIDIVFDEIKSGKDELGKGSLDLLMADGRVGVENFEASIPGGLIKARFMLQPGEESIGVNVFIEAKDFDYGIIARRAVPDSDNKGRLFLDVDITSESDSLDNLLASANGKIGMAVWPENFEAGAFDLWAVGLLNAAATRYGDPSLVNCVVARFSIKDGIMEQDAILIDTSEIRVIGDGIIDFHSETVDFYLVPKAKKAALISVAVPVGLKGNFSDFDLAIHSDDVFKSVFRNTANIVFLGIPLLFHKTLETDGSAACEEAMVNNIDLTVNRPSSDGDN